MEGGVVYVVGANCGGGIARSTSSSSSDVEGAGECLGAASGDTWADGWGVCGFDKGSCSIGASGSGGASGRVAGTEAGVTCPGRRRLPVTGGPCDLPRVVDPLGGLIHYCETEVGPANAGLGV